MRRFTHLSTLLSLSLLFSAVGLFAQVQRFPIGQKSTPSSAEVSLELITRFQQYSSGGLVRGDHYDTDIYSPKSVNITASGKMYVQSLEGLKTVVYQVDSTGAIEKKTVIKHTFGSSDGHLFGGETTVFGYPYKQARANPNIFSGKPVESCLTHKGKYLWVTYYRRTFDPHAESPSAVAIIDTEADTIVRVMPTGPLPKMVAASPDGKWLAITHWGDNTVGILDISSASPAEWTYVKHLVVDRQLAMNFSGSVNRDSNCGYCLRGTVFTPDSDHLIVGRMGGGGLAVFAMDSLYYLGTVWGMEGNVRHLAIHGETLYLTANRSGKAQKASLEGVISAAENGERTFADWKTVYCQGTGARTGVVSPDGRYLFVAVNNHNKIAVVRTEDMVVVATVGADSYPVGMDISPDGTLLAVTSQGRSGGGGNSVMVYRVSYR